MKYLVVGCNGQLGSEFRVQLGDNADYVDIDQLDITNEDAVQKYFANKNYDFVINCAAYTNVDKAEDEQNLAYDVNVNGTKYLAKYGKNIIHISTDYVFDGMNYKPYVETDKPSPILVYGKTKLDGETEALNNAETALVVRSSWMYSSYGNNFVKTMLDLAKDKSEINVIFDQIGSPTYAKDLASVIIKIIPQIKLGSKEIYNYSNEGVCSWYDFASEILSLARLNCKVNPIETKDYPTKAIRPYYSVLNKSKIKNDFGISIRHWKEGLRECINQF